ncbi:hypothetical protein U9M48_032109 [Paspalum notatum var. saurae]|uniref:Uncharacterized protein n=1 Tax=Paspalum notatum var. saurae TaxID=547442 RepID=A0AAQ3U5A2_PASNO
MVIPSLNRPRRATPDPLSVLALLEDEQKFKLGGVLTVASQPSKWATCHIIDPHHEENTSALKSNRKTKHPMYSKAKNAPSHGSTTSTIRGRSKVTNAGLTRGRPTSYKVGRPTLGGIFHVQQPS